MILCVKTTPILLYGSKTKIEMIIIKKYDLTHKET
jgi:hypothetical protein